MVAQQRRTFMALCNRISDTEDNVTERRTFLQALGVLSLGMLLPESLYAASAPLVVYFSKAGEQYGLGVIEKGNTKIAAEILAKKIHADLCEITVKNDSYPRTYKALCDVAKKEKERKERPPYEKTVPDIGGYNVIFIGAPVWYGDWPMVMYSFFENEALSGKTLIPFSTHAGSGLSGFDKKLARACPGSKVASGLAILGSDTQKKPIHVEKRIEGWLKKLSAQGIVLY